MVHNQKDAISYHLVPFSEDSLAQDVSQFADRVKGFSSGLSSFGKKPKRALLIGGREDIAESSTYRDAMLAALKAQRIPTSVLWGQQETKFIYEPGEDTYYIHTELPSGKPKIETLDDFQKAYAKRYIAPGDSLVLGNHEYKPEDLGNLLNFSY